LRIRQIAKRKKIAKAGERGAMLVRRPDSWEISR
jgi:hypothetical protein